MLGRRISVLVAAAILAASSSAALAADKSKAGDFSARAETTVTPSTGLKSLKWDARKGRWGVTLNMDQSDARPSTGNDIQAGAYYRITPSLRVGGAVALRDQQITPGPKKIGAEESQPRVRLESSFKF
jgi:hypothetical protein